MFYLFHLQVALIFWYAGTAAKCLGIYEIGSELITFCIMILGIFFLNVLIITIVLFVSFAGSPDILICGNCREMFSDLVDMMEHKRDYCKLRFTCKCDSLNDETDPSCLECNNSTVPNTQSSNASTNHSRCFFF